VVPTSHRHKFTQQHQFLMGRRTMHCNMQHATVETTCNAGRLARYESSSFTYLGISLLAGVSQFSPHFHLLSSLCRPIRRPPSLSQQSPIPTNKNGVMHRCPHVACLQFTLQQLLAFKLQLLWCVFKLQVSKSEKSEIACLICPQISSDTLRSAVAQNQNSDQFEL